MFRVDAIMDSDSARSTSSSIAIADERGETTTWSSRLEAFRHLGSSLETVIARRSRPYLFVHSGVVTIPEGAILLPGASQSGKSTLVMALLEAGARYASDEFAVIAPGGGILPFARPIALRSGPFGPARQIPIEPLRHPTGDTGIPVHLVCFLQYEEGGIWAVENIVEADAVMELAVNTFGFRERPDEALAMLDDAVNSRPAVRGTRGDARDAAAAILRLAEDVTH